MDSLEVAKGVFDNIPHVNKVWVKGSEYHINNPNSEEWELIEKSQIEEPKKVNKK
jgi:hypothetical protein